eukprot:6291590-Prymnesium_polylepis.1
MLESVGVRPLHSTSATPPLAVSPPHTPPHTASSRRSTLRSSKIYIDCDTSMCASSDALLCSDGRCSPDGDADVDDGASAAFYRGSASTVRLFDWPYSEIGSECARLGKKGWTAVEISPPALAYNVTLSSSWTPSSSWTQRLYPSDLSSLSSASGSEDDLVAAIDACLRARVQVYAAVALNQVGVDAKSHVHD